MATFRSRFLILIIVFEREYSVTLLEAIILGVIQGLAEFLPVSSSGHLMVFHHVLGIESNDNLTFIVVLNLGTLLPLLFIFRKDILELIKQPFQKTVYLLIIATVPIVVATILFGSFIEGLFQSTQFLAFGFLITGIILILTDKIANNSKTIKNMRYLDAVVIGLTQAVAVFPGLSRSGSTISAALARGITREEAAKFSFLMSIPAAFGALVFRILRIFTGHILIGDLNFLNLLVGFFAAAVSGYLSINFMMNLVKKAKLKYFALFYVFGLTALIFFLF